MCVCVKKNTPKNVNSFLRKRSDNRTKNLPVYNIQVGTAQYNTNALLAYAMHIIITYALGLLTIYMLLTLPVCTRRYVSASFSA